MDSRYNSHELGEKRHHRSRSMNIEQRTRCNPVLDEVLCVSIGCDLMSRFLPKVFSFPCVNTEALRHGGDVFSAIGLNDVGGPGKHFFLRDRGEVAT